MPEEFHLEEALQGEIDREVDDLLRQARERAATIVEQARKQGEERLQSARRRLQRELARQRSRILSRAQMEERNALLTVRSQQIDSVIQRAREHLSALAREQPDRFDRLLSKHLQSGRALLPPGPVRVALGGASDRLVQRLKRESDLEVQVVAGRLGLVVSTADGRMACDFTLDHLLERVRQERQWELDELLFGGDGET